MIPEPPQPNPLPHSTTENVPLSGKIGILGVGRLGEALLTGLLKSDGVEPEMIRAAVRQIDHPEGITERHGVIASSDSAAVAEWADTIIVAVKPQSLNFLLDQISGHVYPGDLVVSVVAGKSTVVFETALGHDIPVIRVMTNVPVLVEEAMSAVSRGRWATNQHIQTAMSLFSQVGRVIELPETQIDAVTALSGSGPAYFFLLVEAMIDAGILLGLPRDVATELITQTMVGSALMLSETGKHPVELRESVTSPGGTTISAIRVLEEERVRAAFLNAIEAAKIRSAELGIDRPTE